MTTTFGNLFQPKKTLVKTPVSAPDLPKNYLDDPSIATLVEAISNPGPQWGGVYFVSGRAGTGKSTFVRYLQHLKDINTIVVAPTNLAAINIQGATLHKTFELPIGIVNKERLLSKPMKRKGVLANVERIIIDEASMVRCDILDGVHWRLQEIKQNDLPFGGVQIIMIGDPLQLPPVATNEAEDILAALGYETKYVFSSKALRNLPAHIYTIDKVWRQQNLDFVSILSDIRVNNHRTLDKQLHILNKNCWRPHRDDHVPVLLVPTNKQATAHNRTGLLKHIQTTGRTLKDVLSFSAQTTGSFAQDSATKDPAPRQLKLVPGCRVMLTKNLTTKLYNGRMGTFLKKDTRKDKHGKTQIYLLVQFDKADRPTRVYQNIWQDITYTWSASEQKIREEHKGTFEQYPLNLAYALTIHKSQGMTLSDVRVDTGQGAFEYGQIYVALSRATSMEGLSLQNALTPEDIRTDPDLLELLLRANHTPHYNITKV